MKLMRLATVALVMDVVVMVMSGRKEEAVEQNRDTHTEARSRIGQITNLITNKLQSFMKKPMTDSARSSNIPGQEDIMEEDTNDILGRLEDEATVFSATTDADNIDARSKNAPTRDAKDTTGAHYPNDVLSDAEESTTSDEDDEVSINYEDNYEAFLSPKYDTLDDQVSVDPSTTHIKDKASGGILRFGPMPVAAELSDGPEVPIGDLGNVEAEIGDMGGDAVDDLEGIDAVDDIDDAGDDLDGDAVDDIKGDAVNDVEGDVTVTGQEEEGEEVGAVSDTDSTGDSDVPFDTISSDYEDLTESSSDSDDNDDDDDARGGDDYLSDAFNWYDDYSDYDAPDTDESSDDMMYLNDGKFSDLLDTSDSDNEYDTDSTTSDDEDLPPADVEVAEVEDVAVDEVATAEAEGVGEVPQVEEGNPEAAS